MMDEEGLEPDADRQQYENVDQELAVESTRGLGLASNLDRSVLLPARDIRAGGRGMGPDCIAELQRWSSGLTDPSVLWSECIRDGVFDALPPVHRLE